MQVTCVALQPLGLTMSATSRFPFVPYLFACLLGLLAVINRFAHIKVHVREHRLAAAVDCRIEAAEDAQPASRPWFAGRQRQPLGGIAAAPPALGVTEGMQPPPCEPARADAGAAHGDDVVARLGDAGAFSPRMLYFSLLLTMPLPGTVT